MTVIDENHRAPAQRTLFGHPIGLAVLTGSEMWERFSFYGMQALLTLYLMHQLLKPGHVEHVLLLGPFRRMLEGAFGPMTDLAFASQIFGLYSGLTYASPLLGAWLGDRVIGKTRSVVCGALLMSAGHFMMASEALLLPALALLVIGTGMVTGNMIAQVGALYAPDDHRRTRAFGVYLAGLNVGSLAAPLICGTLGELVGWDYGFTAAGIGMLIGLATYLAGRRHLPPDRIAGRSARKRLTRTDWRRIGGILFALMPYILMMSVVNQAYNVMFIWAEDHVDHRILGWEVPVTWLLVYDGLATIAGIALFNVLWKRMGRREPGDLAKIAIGCLLAALAFLLLGLAALLPITPLLLVFAFYTLMDFGIVWLDPPTASLTSRTAPPAILALMMAVYKLAMGVAYVVDGWLGGFYEPLGPVRFWLMHGAIAASGFVLVLLFGRRAARWLDRTHGVPALDPDAG